MKTLLIDCGGTKSIGYLIDNKQIIEKFASGPANINSSYDISFNNIVKIIRHFENNFDQIKMGIAGIEANPLNLNKLRNDLEIRINVPIEIANDLEMIARISIPKDEKALLINLGTGTAAIQSYNGKYLMHLGWGRIINDIGSGYDIGLHLIKYLCRCEDTNSVSRIYVKFLNDFGISSMREYIPKCNSWNNISNLSEWVASLGHVGNELFILPRVKEVISYLDYIKADRKSVV